jgi:hypothetical protein
MPMVMTLYHKDAGLFGRFRLMQEEAAVHCPPLQSICRIFRCLIRTDYLVCCDDYFFAVDVVVFAPLAAGS